MIIQRKEVDFINRTKAWMLVYGRRKTGKTFLVKNFVKWDYYFFVKRDRSVLYEDNNLSYESFFTLFKTALAENKTIIIDEFHRLPEEFFDFLHYTEKKGRVILVSSTLSLAKRFFSKNSPLLGLFSESLVYLPGLKEVLEATKILKKNKKDWLEISIFLREPIFFQQVSLKNVRKDIIDIILSSRRTIPALIGEIFLEEERTLSMIYEGILRAISCGKINSGEISSYLFSRKLLNKDDPSLIQKHLDILTELGLIRRIKIFDKKRYVYKHTSPVVKVFYFCDEKYNISEREITEKELEDILNYLIPQIIEDSVREAFALKFGLIETIAESKDVSVDGLLLKFQKPEIALEVKWKEEIKDQELEKIEENLNKFKVKKRILFVINKSKIRKLNEVEIMDVSDL